jgi:hypothetical protein
MKEEIEALLRKAGALKAKDIAAALNVEKRDVNSVLYGHSETFTKDEGSSWSLCDEKTIVVRFAGRAWIDCNTFEAELRAVGCLLSSSYTTVIFILPRGCKFLLESSARLLALANQLAFFGKRVKIDFSNCIESLTYFNRNGFLDRLSADIAVLPERPAYSAAKIYQGNSDAVLELEVIDPKHPNKDIPKLLKNKFVSLAGEKYSDAAFTIFSELFANVCEHSETPIHGFAGLQKYRFPRPHLQTVVSDSGKGIIGTLAPVLAEYYPLLSEKFDMSTPLGEVGLLQHVLEQGQISQTGDTEESGRGLGLFRSRHFAVQYSASISVRQENFELKLVYKDNELVGAEHKLSMPRLLGTQVCFDFILDNC